MSGNYFPTGQTPYPVNSQFGFASYSSSTHTTAVEMPWNMNLNCINNQAAGYWHYNQMQPSQPPLPLFPPPQQPPPPPSLPPQENHWLNGYSNHQQINPTPGSGTYQTENVVTYPYPCYPQYPFQSPTSFPAYSSVSQVIQSEFHVAGILNTGSRNVNEKKGPITYLPKLSWNIVSPSVAAPKEENHCKENLINSKKEDKSVVEDDTCKSSASKVDTVPVESTGPKRDCDENGLTVFKEWLSSKPSAKVAVNPVIKGKICACCKEVGHKSRKCPTKVAVIKGDFCVYCKEVGHRARNCPIKPCYKCDKVGHRARNCTNHHKPSAKVAVLKERTCAYCGDVGHRSKNCQIKPCSNCDKLGHKAKMCPNDINCPKYANPLIVTADADFDWGTFLASQPSTSKCVTGANAIPRGSGRSMSISEQSTPSDLNSIAPVNQGSLEIFLNEISKHSTSQKESVQDDNSSAPSRKRQRSCDSLPVEENVSDESLPFIIDSFKGVPRKELEKIIINYARTIADMKRQLNESKEREETLEREVRSLKVTKEGCESVGIRVELEAGVTPDQQNNCQTPSIKIERMEEPSALSGNVFAHATNKDRPNKEIPCSPPSRVSSTVPFLKTPTTNCKSEIVVKTKKL